MARNRKPPGRKSSERDFKARPLTRREAAAMTDHLLLVRKRLELEPASLVVTRLILAAFPLSPPPVAATVDFGPDPEATVRRLAETAGPVAAVIRQARLTLDPEDFRRRGLAVTRVLPVKATLVDPLARAISERRLPLEVWVRSHFIGEPRPEPPGTDPGLICGVARLVSLPALAAVSQRLLSLGLRPKTPQITCPCCGMLALLAEARGLEQHRYLRCGWCAMEWNLPRLTCPACGANRPKDLMVYHVEGQPKEMQLLCCRECDLRLRIVSTVGPLTPQALIYTELASMHLDMIAIEESSDS
jgi:hypothetical protein